jgi:hypothetical protein
VLYQGGVATLALVFPGRRMAPTSLDALAAVVVGAANMGTLQYVSDQHWKEVAWGFTCQVNGALVLAW